MKKYISIIIWIVLTGVLAFSAASCNDELTPSQKITELRFNGKVENASMLGTKAVKTAWATGDKIYVFFNVTAGGTTGHLDAKNYVTLTFNGTSWDCAMSGTLEDANNLGTAGTMYGVHFPFGNITIASDDAGGVTFLDNGNPVYTYYMSGEAAYTVETAGSVATLTGSFNLTIPDNYVSFFIDKDGSKYNTDGQYRLSVNGFIPAACTGYVGGTFSETTLPAGRAVWGYAYGTEGVSFTGKIDDSWATEKSHSFMLYSGDDPTPLTKTFNNVLSSHKSVNLNLSSWTKRAFRGYEISQGILMRNSSGQYELTSGENPFETYEYFGKNENLNKYYFQWSYLQSDDELGASGSEINASSSKLPSGWILPSSNSTSSTYYAMTFMAPKATILVEKTDGTILTIATNTTGKGYCFVLITKGSKQYYGALFLRDGSFIPKEGNINYVGDNTINEISYEQFLVLRDAGCVFLSNTGKALGANDWRYIDYNDYLECYYWSSSSWNSEKGGALRIFKSQNEGYLAIGGNTNKNYYCPVRLVKAI